MSIAKYVVTEVLQILRDNKLYLKHTKCEFEQAETEYLGLIIGVTLDSGRGKCRLEGARVQGFLKGVSKSEGCWGLPQQLLATRVA